jgi:phosphatidylethanolamine-binding protein (PEBP) family uncharacterized protein
MGRKIGRDVRTIDIQMRQLVYGMALCLVATACGSADRTPDTNECPDTCPEAFCNEDTGVCELPDAMEGAPPIVEVTGPTQDQVVPPTVQFNFMANEPSTYTCTLDDVVLTTCEPGMVLENLTSGVHTFTVVATDGDGESSVLVSVTFRVNRPPSVTGPGQVDMTEDTASDNLVYTFSDEDDVAAELDVQITLLSEDPIAATGLAVSGDGATRTIKLTPKPDAFGATMLQISVNDGDVTNTFMYAVTVAPVNDAPTISAIGNQGVEEDTTGPAVGFTVNDIDNAAAGLTVSYTSSNTGLIHQTSGITFGGAGTDRTFVIHPTAGQSGTSNIVFTVSDGDAIDTEPFVVTVAADLDPPTLAVIPNQTTAEDTNKVVNLTVGDPDTALADLDLDWSPAANPLVQSITFGGTTAARTATIVPKANQTGNLAITISVTDSVSTAQRTFTLTVTPVNDAPTLSAINDVTLEPNTASSSLQFTISDPDGDTAFTVTGSSNDTTVVPNANIAFVGAPNRSVTVTPANNQGGVATVTVTATDAGGLSDTETFVTSVKVRISGAASPSDGGTVTVAGGACNGQTSCTALPSSGTVTFNASPNPGFVHTGWSGCTNGVVNPIPNTPVTCTATFRGLWARTFTTRGNSAPAQLLVDSASRIRYLGSVDEEGKGSTALLWSSRPSDGAPVGGTQFILNGADNGLLTLTDAVTAPANGLAVLSDDPSQQSAVVFFANEKNELLIGAQGLAEAYTYPSTGQLAPATPLAIVRNGSQLAFLEKEVPPAQGTVIARLVRLDDKGETLSTNPASTRFLNGFPKGFPDSTSCSSTEARTINPIALAVDSEKQYLILSNVESPNRGTTAFALTVIDTDGNLKSHRIYYIVGATRGLAPSSLTVAGGNILVTGIVQAAAGTTYDNFAVLLDSALNVSWAQSFGVAERTDFAYDAVAVSGGFVFIGASPVAAAEVHYDVFALPIKTNGDIGQGRTYGGTKNELGTRIAVGADGFYLFGYTASFPAGAALAWGLEVGGDLDIVLKDGAVGNYTPGSADLKPVLGLVNGCVNDQMYQRSPFEKRPVNITQKAADVTGTYQSP